MNDSPSSILAKYLIDMQGAFVNPGDSGEWPLYKVSLPDGSGIAFEAASIHDTTPVVDAKAMDGTYVQAHGIQIHVRSKEYETGRTKLSGVVEDLAKVHGVTVPMTDGSVYEIVNVGVASDAVYIGPDEKQRAHFTANLLLKLKSL
jgi:hypothetical protein